MAPGAREAMWPAPTAEDWAKPCLVTWQRTWEDAVAVAEETGQAILVCVNMDGEIASEHYAGIRYRQPDIAVLYEPYVTVIASVYRHSPRDHDEQGRRVLCPRFGTVTCGEHIAIEPVLFDQYFEDTRVAPRHIMVELDKSETYDVYYAFDTASVFQTIEDGVKGREYPPQPEQDEGSILDLVASADVGDRETVERAYGQGGRELRVQILSAASRRPERASLDLLRLAMAGFDPELARMARGVLVGAEGDAAISLILDALKEPMPEAERQALVAALSRLGEHSPRARVLAAVQQGLDGGPGTLDVERWAEVLAMAPEQPVYAGAVDARIETQGEVLTSEDGEAHLDLAEAFLTSAYEYVGQDDEHSRFLLMDARDTALAAEALGERGWRVDTVLSVADYYLGNVASAQVRAVAAMQAGLPPDALGWNTMAVLAIFAQQRQEAISAAVNAKQDWPAEWLADVHNACLLLARHPHGTPDQVVAHYDFLEWLGGRAQAKEVLDVGLERFPGSWELHARLRWKVMRNRGVDDLERVYSKLMARPDAPPEYGWFAGFASMVAAEFHRRWGEDEQAVLAYDKAIATYEVDAALHPDDRAAHDHDIALALAAKARLAYEAGHAQAAVDDLLASFERMPEAAASPDGLNISPADTARMLRSRLHDEGEAELLARLEQALQALDPELLELPAYERGVPAGDPGRGRAPFRGRGGGGPQGQ
jgi:tetratricopeptide (TPR) repeat protein